MRGAFVAVVNSLMRSIFRARFHIIALASAVSGALLAERIAYCQASAAPAVRILITDDETAFFSGATPLRDERSRIEQTSLLQPAAPLLPPARAEPEIPLEGPASELARRLLGAPPGAELTVGQLALRQ